MTSRVGRQRRVRGCPQPRRGRRGRILRGAVVTIAIALGPGVATALAAVPATLDMADVFLVEQDGGWFCSAGKQANNATCPARHDSRAAAIDLLRELFPGRYPDLYLRVGKARNDCHDPFGGQRCSTGVPRSACRSAFDFASPACALDELLRRGVRLGVVIGARGAGGTDRSVRNISWHACQVSLDDTRRYYDFIFLDLAFRLGHKLAETVRLIQAGHYRNGVKELPCPRGAAGHRVMTNDTTWKPGRAKNAPLNTGAWAHAKRLSLLDGENGIGVLRAAGVGDPRMALTDDDRAFVSAVQAENSLPVLRFEVPAQTSRFAALEPQLQCQLLARWSSLQAASGYTFIHPIYVHGAGPAEPATKRMPYDSFAEGTFVPQIGLFRGYPSLLALPPDFCGTADADIPCGAVRVTPRDLGRRWLQVTKTRTGIPTPLSCARARSIIRTYAERGIPPLLWNCGTSPPPHLGSYSATCTGGPAAGWSVVGRVSWYE